MRIRPIPCLKDNYAYLVVCEETREAAIVDASEAAPVLGVLAEETGVRVRALWCTHHHWDHVGGNEEVVAKLGVPVLGHASDKGRIPGQTGLLETGARFGLGALEVETMHIPGHTLGAIAYVVRGRSEALAVFTGDTLFLAGCGRLFEGTPAQMHASLSSLAGLPPETRVYCGHEYTEQNLRFAAHVESSNAAVARARERAAHVRGEGKPTVPGTLGEERATNPFLRVDSGEIRKAVGVAPDASPVEAFAAIRRAKDEFR
jgi:hydroxyacylglutathione hydrolase